MKVYVPLNKEGIEELELCFEHETKNLKVYVFSSDDYFYLEKCRYLDFLNVECDCIIDLYEDEDIPNEKLKNALNITKILIRQSNDPRFINLAKRFVEIFELAIKCGTYINIYCYGNLNND